MQHVSNSSTRTIAALPRLNNSQQGEARASPLSLALLGAAVAVSTLLGVVVSAAPPAECDGEVLEVEEELTPLYEPVFRYAGMLKVSDTHTISYKVYGNPRGKPVLCVHGGPGAGTGTGKVRERPD
jgi:hypothetical protein